MTYVSPDYLTQIARQPSVAQAKSRAYRLMNLRPGERVLDIGCGPGTSTIALARLVGPTGMVVGVDHDLGMIARANAFAVRAGVAGWTRHQLGNCVNLP